jgi:hypothetical protein
MPLTLLRHATQKPPTGPLKLDVGNPYAAGLELWYLGSERSGPNIQDFATLRPGRKGALAGGASWTPGKIGGGALKFASATDMVNIGTAHGLPSSATQAWTFSLWANWHDTTTATQTLIAAGYAGAPFSVELVNSGGLYLRYAYGGGTGTFLHREDTWPLDTWRHIFITDDGLGNTNSSSLWINGVPTAWETGTETGAHVTSYDSYGVALGARQPFVDNNLNGQIDNVMVWSRALPPAAATTFYTEPFHLAQTRPLQRWFVVASGAPPAISGSGGVTIGKPALAAAGSQAFTGSGAATIQVPSLVAAATETFVGAGAATIAAPSLAATGLETFSGTAAVTLAAPTIAASGALAFGGTAAITIGAPSLAGTGVSGDAINGSAGLTIQRPGLAAAGLETFAGTGGLTITVPSLSGAGALTFVGSATITIGPPSLSAIGTSGDVISGPATLTIQKPSLAAAGLLAFAGAGDLTIQKPVLAGSGLLAYLSTGTLTISAPGLAASGIVLLAITGTGAIVIARPSLLGAEVVLVPVPRLSAAVNSGRSSVVLATSGRSTAEVP